MALEVAVTALLRAFEDRNLLAMAWKDAEDQGFTWTSDAVPGMQPERQQWAQESYLNMLARLRKLALEQ
jgi:hypothetical protein